MLVVGLTGGIGCGKSEVARLFAELGAQIVDTDVIAHQMTAPGSPMLPRIAEALGPDSLNADGSFNRSWVRQRVFSDPAARLALENLLHPAIRSEVDAQLRKPGDALYQIVVVPLLFETGGYDDRIGCSLLVDCPESLQIQRTMQRSGMDERSVRAIMAAQLAREEKLALADDVIVNEGSLQQLREKVVEKHKKYIKACSLS